MTTAGTRRAGTTTLLLIQVVIGYEWLVSALTKLSRGDFPAGLAAQLGDMSKDAPGWYRGLLTGVVVPHADAFGWTIEITELVAGVVLVALALVLLVRPALRLPRPAILAAVAASAAALAMVANFELATGAGFGLSLGKDTFDEGVDLDTLMTGLQLALLLFWGAALRRPAQEPTSNSRSVSLSDIRSCDSSLQPTISGVGKP
ncbi:MAG: thiosulfate dehydrogenase (quinone) large subunit [Gaiellaceae bacterium]|nr:thiosulfate dehydrogenase (quinone) large subunit [Gaiellaceae bacterium]